MPPRHRGVTGSSATPGSCQSERADPHAWQIRQTARNCAVPRAAAQSTATKCTGNPDGSARRASRAARVIRLPATLVAALDPVAAAAPEAPKTLEATPEWVEVAEIPAQWSAAMQEGSGWRYWLVDAQMDMRTDAGEAYYDYAYEATTSERLGEAGRYEISFRAEYQSIALHRVEVRRAASGRGDHRRNLRGTPGPDSPRPDRGAGQSESLDPRRALR